MYVPPCRICIELLQCPNFSELLFFPLESLEVQEKIELMTEMKLRPQKVLNKCFCKTQQLSGVPQSYRINSVKELALSSLKGNKRSSIW